MRPPPPDTNNERPLSTIASLRSIHQGERRYRCSRRRHAPSYPHRSILPATFLVAAQLLGGAFSAAIVETPHSTSLSLASSLQAPLRKPPSWLPQNYPATSDWPNVHKPDYCTQVFGPMADDSKRINHENRTSSSGRGIELSSQSSLVTSIRTEVERSHGESLDPKQAERADFHNTISWIPSVNWQAPSKRQTAEAAYSSGMIADWAHQSRSVWFQRKAIIIISCFLAIFIVLIIGAAVFLRDHREDLDDADEEDDEFSDEAALRRMREERKMRSGSQGKKKKAKADRVALQSGRDVEEEFDGTAKPHGSRFRRSKITGQNQGEGSSSGSSSALSKKLVSRWVRSSRVSSFESSASGAENSRTTRASADDAASARSQRSMVSPRSRLGARRSEQVEVVYSGGSSTPPVRTNSTGAASQSVSAPLPDSSDYRHSEHGSTPTSSNARSAAEILDCSDFLAVDAAEHAIHETNLPPAYIPDSTFSRESSSLSQFSPFSPLTPPTSAPSRPTYQRPLAGEFTDNVKARRQSPTLTDSAPGPEIPPRVLALLDCANHINGVQDNSADLMGNTAHLATDDKARLAALAAAASAPGANHHSDASTPQYAATTGTSTPFRNASGQDIADADDQAAPSAPALLDEYQDGVDAFASPRAESLGLDVAGQFSPAYQPLWSDLAPTPEKVTQLSGESKGKGKGFLPAPPSPHAQAFSPFDQPYRVAWPLSPVEMSNMQRLASSTEPVTSLQRRAVNGDEDDSQPSSTVLTDQACAQSTARYGEDATSDHVRQARRLEKQREAEEELTLVASSPADFASRRDIIRRPTESLEESGTDLLPAYERGAATLIVANPEPESANAPDVDDILQLPERSSLDAGSKPDLPEESSQTALPSAPAAYDDD